MQLAGSLPFKRLKIDAQGVDFNLIKSVEPELLRRRVASIQLEARTVQCNPLYTSGRRRATRC